MIKLPIKNKNKTFDVFHILKCKKFIRRIICYIKDSAVWLIFELFKK